MSKQEHQRTPERDPYWSGDIGLFAGRFRYTRDEPAIVRARVHTSEERYRLDEVDTEIVPVTTRAGTRAYVHLQPYVAFPDIRLTVGLSPAPRPGGAISEVLSVEERGMRRERIGNAQAWHYPADRTLVLWEALIEERFRDTPLAEDANMRRLWLGIEDFLTTRFPAATKIATPFDDPAFETADYRAFLGSLGYAPVARAAYGKEIKHIP